MAERSHRSDPPSGASSTRGARYTLRLRRGQYDVWARVLVPARFGNGLGTSSSDTAWLQVCDHPALIDASHAPPETWQWVRALRDIDLPAGTTSLDLRVASTVWRSTSSWSRISARVPDHLLLSSQSGETESTHGRPGRGRRAKGRANDRDSTFGQVRASCLVPSRGGWVAAWLEPVEPVRRFNERCARRAVRAVLCASCR